MIRSAVLSSAHIATVDSALLVETSLVLQINSGGQASFVICINVVLDECSIHSLAVVLSLFSPIAGFNIPS